VGIDISGQSIREAHRRYHQSKYTYPALFYAADCCSTLPELPLRSFDIVTTQFMIHYAFATESSLDRFLQNVRDNLSSPGVWIVTFPDSEQIRIYSNKRSTFGNRLFEIYLPEHTQKILQSDTLCIPCGYSYTFSMRDCIEDMDEFLVSFPFLKEKANAWGMSLKESGLFRDFFHTHRKYSTKKWILDKEELDVIGLYRYAIFSRDN
jgi:mRNA (guanine-N7-)-methyltransferase